MTPQEKELLELEAQVSLGLEIAYSKMLAFKKYKGTPVVISHKGEIIYISPEDFITVE